LRGQQCRRGETEALVAAGTGCSARWWRSKQKETETFWRNFCFK
jgi:hypothetical protein